MIDRKRQGNDWRFRGSKKHRHELSRAILEVLTKNAQKLVSTIEGFINPLSYQINDIINLVTKAVMLEKIKQDICLIEVGVSKMETFIQ